MPDTDVRKIEKASDSKAADTEIRINAETGVSKIAENKIITITRVKWITFPCQHSIRKLQKFNMSAINPCQHQNRCRHSVPLPRK